MFLQAAFLRREDARQLQKALAPAGDELATGIGPPANHFMRNTIQLRFRFGTIAFYRSWYDLMA